METLIFFAEETQAKPFGSYDDIVIAEKCLRIIYHKRILNKFSIFLFKRKIKKLTKGCTFYLNDFTRKFKGEKIYRTGHALVLFHLADVVKIAAENLPILIYSVSASNIDLLKELLMSYKNIKFLTTAAALDKFNEKLLDNFGIGGGAACRADASGKAVIIMPGGDVFSPEGAKTIINLSKKDIAWKSVEPKNILFKVPPHLKEASNVLRRADAMETALSFLGQDFGCTKPVSVKINKQKV